MQKTRNASSWVKWERRNVATWERILIGRKHRSERHVIAAFPLSRDPIKSLRDH